MSFEDTEPGGESEFGLLTDDRAWKDVPIPGIPREFTLAQLRAVGVAVGGFAVAVFFSVMLSVVLVAVVGFLVALGGLLLLLWRVRRAHVDVDFAGRRLLRRSRRKSPLLAFAMRRGSRFSVYLVGVMVCGFVSPLLLAGLFFSFVTVTVVSFMVFFMSGVFVFVGGAVLGLAVVGARNTLRARMRVLVRPDVQEYFDLTADEMDEVLAELSCVDGVGGWYRCEFGKFLQGVGGLEQGR